MHLGQQVKVSAYLVRKTEYGDKRPWGDAKKVWRRAVYPSPQAGIVIGLRTVSDGVRVNLGEEGLAYKATAHHRVALVAFDLNRAPKHVLLDDLTKEPTREQ